VGVNIEIDDQFDGNCWTNKEVIKSRMRLTFEQSNISVFDEAHFVATAHFPTIVITGLGTRNKAGTCLGAGKVSAQIDAAENFGSDTIGHFSVQYRRTVMHELTGVFTNGQNLDAEMSEVAEKFAADFAANVIAGRRSTKVKALNKVLPGLSEHRSYAEFERSLKNKSK
jgi:hypothetical protein